MKQNIILLSYQTEVMNIIDYYCGLFRIHFSLKVYLFCDFCDITYSIFIHYIPEFVISMKSYSNKTKSIIIIIIIETKKTDIPKHTKKHLLAKGSPEADTSFQQPFQIEAVTKHLKERYLIYYIRCLI